MPTMKTIAAKAGVSVMTVSLALRNDHRISPATRQRIQDIAQQLGYRSNPMIATLMTHIRASRPVTYQANLAFLAENIKRVLANHVFRSAYEGVIKRAEELGFLVDVFSLDDVGLRRGHLAKVLETRNIQGIILAPLRKAGSLEGLEGSRWSATALGNSVLSPRFHRVTHHQAHGIQLVIDRLMEKGYRRIGLAIEEENDEKVDRSWSSGMAGHHLRIPARQRVPVLLCPLDSPSLAQWLKKHRPDVVIGHEGLYMALKRLGLKVPEDVAFASLSVVGGRHANFAGLNQNWPMVGAAAVESVVAQIYRNERGAPECPKTIMLEGFWVDGATAPGV